MLAGEELPQTHLKHTDTKGLNVETCQKTEGGLNHESGVGKLGCTHLLWQEVNILFVPSFWSAVQLYQSQGLTQMGQPQFSVHFYLLIVSVLKSKLMTIPGLSW